MMTSKSAMKEGGGVSTSSSTRNGMSIFMESNNSKYARYTDEQVAILEQIYDDCPKPTSARRQQLLRDFPILANVGLKQLKVWFQNRRCREKQRKETCRLLTWNAKLNAMNQVLIEENERLYKQAAQLNVENQLLRQQMQLQLGSGDLNQRSTHQMIMATTENSSESTVVTSGMPHQNSPQQQQDQYARQSHLFAIAEETLQEFLVKTTESTADWVQIPGMKPGPDSTGVVSVSNTTGVAARTCGFIDLEPVKGWS